MANAIPVGKNEEAAAKAKLVFTKVTNLMGASAPKVDPKDYLGTTGAYPAEIIIHANGTIQVNH